MKVQDVMDSSVAFSEYALTARESIDELVKVIEQYEAAYRAQVREIELLSRELAAANVALDRLDVADRNRR